MYFLSSGVKGLSIKVHNMLLLRLLGINPFTPELKKCILPTFQKAIV